MQVLDRDLASTELWLQSLEKSRHRRAITREERRRERRRKQTSSAAVTAMLAAPALPLPKAKAGDDLDARIASEAPATKTLKAAGDTLPLSVGSQGAKVAEVQRALGIPADGEYGPRTDAAVRAFQARVGIGVDGVVGPITWSALFPPVAAASDDGADVGVRFHAVTEGQRSVSIGGPQLPEQVKSKLAKAKPGTVVRARAETKPRKRGAERKAETGPAVRRAPRPDTRRVAVGGGPCSSTIGKPVKGTVTSPYGPRWGRMHEGIDISAPTGTAVRSVACGTVSFAGQQGGYGNIICVKHTASFATCYAHLSVISASVGERVKAGELIGRVGCTGSCTGPHLHFETRVNGSARDPRPYLAGSGMPGGTRMAKADGRSGTRMAQRRTAARATAASMPESSWRATGKSSGSTGGSSSQVTMRQAPAQPTPPPASQQQQAAPTQAAPTQPAPTATQPAPAAPVQPPAPVQQAPAAPAVPPVGAGAPEPTQPVTPPVAEAPVQAPAAPSAPQLAGGGDAGAGSQSEQPATEAPSQEQASEAAQPAPQQPAPRQPAQPAQAAASQQEAPTPQPGAAPEQPEPAGPVAAATESVPTP